MIHTVKGFSIINEAEVDVFLELPCFLHDPLDVGNLIFGFFASSKPRLYIWKFLVHECSNAYRDACVPTHTCRCTQGMLSLHLWGSAFPGYRATHGAAWQPGTAQRQAWTEARGPRLAGARRGGPVWVCRTSPGLRRRWCMSQTLSVPCRPPREASSEGHRQAATSRFRAGLSGPQARAGAA